MYQEYINNVLQEKQIQFNRNTDVAFGNVVILAGGSGSGKGFVLSNLIGIEGKIMNVDALKVMAVKAKTVIERAAKEFGIDVSEFSGPGAMKKPENVRRLHVLLSNQLGIVDAKQRTLFISVATADPKRKPNLIFDTTLSSLSKLVNLAGSLDDLGYDKKKIHIVWVLNDIAVAREQNQKRSRTVPDEILVNTHEGVSTTMAQIISDGEMLRKYMDGDFFISFNQVGIDTEIAKSSSGGKYVKAANYVQIKKVGNPLKKESISQSVMSTISSYVPDSSKWEVGKFANPNLDKSKIKDNRKNISAVRLHTGDWVAVDLDGEVIPGSPKFSDGAAAAHWVSKFYKH